MGSADPGSPILPHPVRVRPFVRHSFGIPRGGGRARVSDTYSTEGRAKMMMVGYPTRVSSGQGPEVLTRGQWPYRPASTRGMETLIEIYAVGLRMFLCLPLLLVPEFDKSNAVINKNLMQMGPSSPLIDY